MNDTIKPVMIDEQLCNGCGRCSFICSMGVIEIQDRTDCNNGKIAVVSRPEYCMYCEACVIDCKRGAIRLNPQSGSINIEKISGLMMKKKKSRFMFWRK